MPVELMHPFSLSANGGIAATSDPDRQINQHVNTLLLTEPGERRVETDYGVPTRSLLFENNSNLIALGITDQIREKMAAYEPGVLIQKLDVVPYPEGIGGSEVKMQYARREAASSPAGISKSVNTAVVNIGGKVDEVING